MWLPTRKIKVAILKDVFRGFKTNIEKKFEQRIRQFFIMFGTFFSYLSNSQSLIRTQNFLKKQ
jgi:hypothetical protein